MVLERAETGKNDSCAGRAETEEDQDACVELPVETEKVKICVGRENEENQDLV
jgi:hypothetical protein